MHIVTRIVLGVIAGAVLAFFTGGAIIYYEAHTMETKVNGWSTTLEYGKWDGNILKRAAFSQVLPAINVPEEGVYWTTAMDNSGSRLTGLHNYTMHFPPGGLPPNNAFWSLTMTDRSSHMVDNPVNRYNLGTFSNLTRNPDGSVDLYLQNEAPAGHESNWLPAPSGNFMLWLRAYLPGPAILNGTYQVPPVVEVP